MKILISWIALSNDFAENEVNSEGPNYFFHKYHFNYDLHVLLHTVDAETKAVFLQNKLSLDFPEHKIKLYSVNINDISNLELVKTKVENILLQFAEDEIDIFFSPGASIMQLSWYICHTTLGLKTRLVQMMRKEHSKSKDIPDLVYIESTFSEIPRSAILKQNLANKKDSSDKEFMMSESIEKIYSDAEKIAKTDSVTVLITGQTGIGKEHLAKFIHKNSARRNMPFEALNCGGFTDELLESRLFGHKKGSFTGAVNNETGIFKNADGGTVFLDEIGDITPYMQQLLLRVLQEKEIRPVGGNTQKVDIRIISATNKSLLELVSLGKFRSDLYYRLAVTDLHLPNLDERGISEKRKLTEFFVEQKRFQFKRINKIKLSDEIIKFIDKYRFPGNIRELENLIERFYVFCETDVNIENIPSNMKISSETENLLLAVIEKNHIKYVLEKCNNNKSEASKILGISLNNLKNKIKD